MKTLQILQGQFTGFHFLISFLNPAREFIVLINYGSEMFGFLLVEPLEHHFLVGFDYLLTYSKINEKKLFTKVL